MRSCWGRVVRGGEKCGEQVRRCVPSFWSDFITTLSLREGEGKAGKWKENWVEILKRLYPGGEADAAQSRRDVM